MAVRIEKDGSVWTIVHDRPEARNAMFIGCAMMVAGTVLLLFR